MAFDVHSLMDLIRNLNTLLHHGDESPDPMPGEDRHLLQVGLGQLCQRLFETALGAQPKAADMDVLYRIVQASDCFVAHGDGVPSPVSAQTIAITHALRNVISRRIATFPPHGRFIAMGLDTSEEAKAAAVVAAPIPVPVVKPAPQRQVQRPAEAAPPPPPPVTELSLAAEPPPVGVPEPVPTIPPVPPAEEPIPAATGSFRFGAPRPLDQALERADTRQAAPEAAPEATRPGEIAPDPR